MGQILNHHVQDTVFSREEMDKTQICIDTDQKHELQKFIFLQPILLRSTQNDYLQCTKAIEIL